MEFKKVIICLVLIPSICLAQKSNFSDRLDAEPNVIRCPEDVQVIKAGDSANCDGFLFSDEAEKRAAQAVEDSEYYKALAEKLTTRLELEKKETSILEQRLNNYRNEAQTLSKEVGQTRSTENLYRIGYFALGALITGYIAANVNK